MVYFRIRRKKRLIGLLLKISLVKPKRHQPLSAAEQQSEKGQERVEHRQARQRQQHEAGRGDSVIDPRGEILWRESERECIHTCTLAYHHLSHIRESLPFLKDGDEFEIKM